MTCRAPSGRMDRVEGNAIRMTEFHCTLHASPSTRPKQTAYALDGKSVMGIKLNNVTTRFAISFEEVAQRFESIPRFFFEYDGSFVWVAERKSTRFQLDGTLYDDGRHLLNVELKGTCDSTMLDEFLACLGWPEQPILFQLVQHGIYMTEVEFRRNFTLS